MGDMNGNQEWCLWRGLQKGKQGCVVAGRATPPRTSAPRTPHTFSHTFSHFPPRPAPHVTPPGRTSATWPCAPWTRLAARCGTGGRAVTRAASCLRLCVHSTNNHVSGRVICTTTR
jgi:hypothetical protein